MVHFVGCICVYSSADSLDFILDTVNKTFLSASDERLQYQGLPVILMQAYDKNLTEKGMLILQDEGRSLAQRLENIPIISSGSIMIFGFKYLEALLGKYENEEVNKFCIEQFCFYCLHLSFVVWSRTRQYRYQQLINTLSGNCKIL